MSDEKGYRISATIKGQGSSKYDAPWIVVYGDTPEEVDRLLSEVADRGLPGTLASLDAAFKGDTNVAMGLGGRKVTDQGQPTTYSGDVPGSVSGGSTGPYQQTVSSPAPQASAPQGQGAAQSGSGGGACAHGQRVWKQWTRGKDGKEFKGWFCPANVEGCKPEWRN